jgi:hypothetical protein
MENLQHGFVNGLDSKSWRPLPSRIEGRTIRFSETFLPFAGPKLSGRRMSDIMSRAKTARSVGPEGVGLHVSRGGNGDAHAGFSFAKRRKALPSVGHRRPAAVTLSPVGRLMGSGFGRRIRSSAYLQASSGRQGKEPSVRRRSRIWLNRLFNSCSRN